MSTTVSYRGYDGSMIYDSEDQLYYGKILGIGGFILYHGDTSEQAEQIFHHAVDDYLAFCAERGEQPPQPFAGYPSSMPHELRVKAALYAHEHRMDEQAVLSMKVNEFFALAA